jgi:hypothetical protein
MSQKLHDPLAKEYLEALLETKGQVKISYELPQQAFQIDVMCTPQTPPVDSTPLGLLGNLVTAESLLEAFWNPPSRRDCRTCLLKLFLYQNQLYNRARRRKQSLAETELPQLWLLATSAPQELIEDFYAQPSATLGDGVYVLGPSLKAGVVAINQLPVTPDTLWLRLLGRGATFEQARQELLDLPRDNPLRDKVVEVLSGYHLNLNLTDKSTLSNEEQELVMRLSPIYLKWREETRQEGVQQERRDVTEQLLKTRFGGLDEALLKVQNRVSQLSPEEFLPLLLRLSREELVAKFT